MAREPAPPRRVPIRAGDGFMLAIDGMMRRTGQGEHLGSSVLELDRAPQLDALNDAWRRFVQAHPITMAGLTCAMPGAMPHWRVPGQVEPERVSAIEVWREPEAPGSYGEQALPIASLATLCRQRLNGPQSVNVRLDVIERADGCAALVMTWSHLLLDAKGAELMLTDIARRCAGSRTTEAAETGQPALEPAKLSISQRRRQRIRFIQRFRHVMHTPSASLGGNVPRPGAAHLQVLTLDAAAAAQVRQRAAALASELITTPFFLACAARAHDCVLQRRGASRSQVITLPIQMRPKGATAAATGAMNGTDQIIFQNHLSMLFFHLDAEQGASVEAATHAIQQQFLEAMRQRLDLAFIAMQDAMRRVPPRLYMAFLRWQGRGQLASFFHSHTGAFAPSVTHIAGADVTNAYHLPSVCTPPGTGLFVNERGPHLNAVLSWRGEAVDADERRAMLERFVHDLTGDAAARWTPLFEV